MDLLTQSPNKNKAMDYLHLKDKLTLKELKPLGFTQSSIKYHVAQGRIRIYTKEKRKKFLYSVEDVVKLLATFKTKGNVNPNPPKRKK